MRLSVRGQKGQNVVEYLVLVCAVVAVLIAALAKGGAFSGAVNDMIASPIKMIEKRNQEINLVVDNRPKVDRTVCKIECFIICKKVCF